MADLTIDVCGEVCPVPVMKTDEALSTMKTGQTLEVIVDYPPSKENVQRLATFRGNKIVEVKEEGEIIKILIEKA